MPHKLLIIIPCYNEEAALPALLNTLPGIRLNQNYQVEIAVINDCSTDNTLAVARQHSVTVIDLPVNLGIGGAVQSGLIYAHQNDFDLAVQMDGDGQHPPHELVKLLACYETSGANLIIGSRFIEREGFQSSFARRLGVGYFHWLNKVFTGHSIFDSTSGFRLFDREAISLGAEHYPDEYPEPESLILFARVGLAIKETPVIMSDRQGGQSSIRNFASLYYCIKVTIAMVFASIRKIE
jgi:glycosyltransferase involved in cell wall biosynthesis